MDLLVFLSIALSGDFAQISHICVIMVLCPLPIHLHPCALFTLWSFTLHLISVGLLYFLSLISTEAVFIYFLNSGIYFTDLSLLGTSNFIQVRYLLLYSIYPLRVTRVSFRPFHFSLYLRLILSSLIIMAFLYFLHSPF